MTMVRSVVASGLCVAAAVCMRSYGDLEVWQLWIPTAFLAVAAILALHRRSHSQLLVRAVLWSNLLLAVVVAWFASGRDQLLSAALGAATGLALLALGHRGPDDDRGPFVPVAFRGTLVALLVMALADAQTLLFWGSVLVGAWKPRPVTGFFALGFALAFSLGVVGMYRLRTWGLLVNSMAALALLAAVAIGAFSELGPFRLVFAGSAALQLAAAVPLYRALVRGTPRAPSLSKASVWVGSLAVEVLVLAAVGPALAHLVG